MELEELIEAIVSETDPDKVLEYQKQVFALLSDTLTYRRYISEIQNYICGFYGLKPRYVSPPVPEGELEEDCLEKLEQFLLMDDTRYRDCMDIRKNRDFLLCILKKLSVEDPRIKPLVEAYESLSRGALWFTDLFEIGSLRL